MKILHGCLASSYSDGLSYQDNLFVHQNLLDGHEVLVASEPRAFVKGSIVELPVGRSVGVNGENIVRLARPRWMPAALNRKLHRYPGFGKLLNDFEPDIIFFHSIVSEELMDAVRYKKKHPKTLLVADSHASFFNSASSFISSALLHRGLYRSLYRRSKAYIDKLYYIGYDEYDYLHEIFGVQPDEAELLSLGYFLTPPEKRAAARREVRGALGIPDDAIVFVHSGKIIPAKRTDILLDAFRRTDDPRFRLLIIGSADDSMRRLIEDAAAADDRILYPGWMDSDELCRHICASDLYLQPGSVSITMQTALCCGTPVLVRPFSTYTRLLGEYCASPDSAGDANCAVCADSADEIEIVFRRISSGELDLAAMVEASRRFAAGTLDVAEQMQRLYALYYELNEKETDGSEPA